MNHSLHLYSMCNETSYRKNIYIFPIYIFFFFSVHYIITFHFYIKLLMFYFKQYDKLASLIMVILSNPYMYIAHLSFIMKELQYLLQQHYLKLFVLLCFHCFHLIPCFMEAEYSVPHFSDDPFSYPCVWA